MTVKELIKELKKLPPDTQIYVWLEEEGYSEPRPQEIGREPPYQDNPEGYVL
jgi:hypothetical protein